MLPRFFYYLKNIWYREPLFIFKYYLFHKKRDSNRLDYVFMADGKMVHGGLFDRLKGAVSIYALSIVHKKRFAIKFDTPFQLKDYLIPNRYDWLSNCEIDYAFPFSKPVIAYSEISKPRRIIKQRSGQTHYYFGGDILDAINKKYGTSFEWSILFHQLFKPSGQLENYLIKLKNEISSDYFAIHLRFLNLLGDSNEKGKYKELDENGKARLVSNCIKVIGKLGLKHKKLKIVVTCDSMIFLNNLKKKIPDVFIVPGDIKHIDKYATTSNEDNLKLFADVYLLAYAKYVYSIVGSGLYMSAFPEYAAKIGIIPFSRISL